MQIPAICEKCNSIVASGIEVQNSLHLTLMNNITNCPFCGGIAHTIDGTFNIIGNTISVLKAGNITKENMSLLLSILENNKNADSSEKIKEEINKNIPECKKISDLLPKNKSDLYSFIAILIAIIQTYISLSSQNNNINIEQAFYQTNYYINENKTDNKDINKIIKNKIGRNDTCPCGSGKKYKKCCGRNNEIVTTNLSK